MGVANMEEELVATRVGHETGATFISTVAKFDTRDAVED